MKKCKYCNTKLSKEDYETYGGVCEIHYELIWDEYHEQMDLSGVYED